MPDDVTTAERGIVQRAGLAVAHRALVIALPILVLVQAALAGQFMFGGEGRTLHGVLGNISFTVTVLIVVLVVVRRRAGIEFAVAVALTAMAFAQVGLGYVGRDNLDAASWHVPLGVAIFGLACYQLALVTRDQRT
jgi:hypothetical protein